MHYFLEFLRPMFSDGL